MSKVNVCREVDLDQGECNDLALQLLEKLVAKFGGGYASEGDNYRYKHSLGVNALVEPRSGELNVDVKLGIMARKFAPQFEKEMNRALDEHLNA